MVHVYNEKQHEKEVIVMRKTGSNRMLSFGMLAIAVSNILKHTVNLHEFAHGLILGVGLVLMLLGAYAVNHDITKLTNLKRKCIKALIR